MTKSRLLVGILAASLVANLITLFTGAFSIFQKPYDLLIDEGGLWTLSTQVSLGLPLYQPVTSTQMTIVPQTPIQILLVGWISNLVGDPLIVGRILSLTCGLLVCGLVFLIVRKLTGNSWIGVMSALLVTSLSVFRFLSVISRMDTMGLMFALAGIFIVLQFEHRGKLLYWSIPLFVLAFFTKQLFITAPVAVCIYLLIKNWRVSFKYGGLYLASLGIGLLVANLLTNGQFLLHVFAYTSQIARGFFWGVPGVLVIDHLILWVAIVGYLGYRLVEWRSFNLVDIYLLVALPVLIYLIGKPGSAFHYGLESLVLGCILVGVLLNSVSGYFKEKPSSMERLPVLGCILILIVMQSVGVPFGKGYTTAEYQDKTGEAAYGVVEYMVDKGGPVFGLANSGPLIEQSGIEMDRYTPAILIRGDLKDGPWDQSVTVERLETGYYNLVLLDFDLEYAQTRVGYPMSRMLRARLTPEMEEAMVQNYILDFKSGKLGTPLYPYYVYLYKYNGGN